MKKSKIYLPGLNGLRAIAALFVLVGHVQLEGISDFNLPYKLTYIQAGYGVTLFFVISGFLITYLLLDEIQNIKNVNVLKFYMRRVLRIWPLYYSYIIVCYIVFLFYGKQNEITVSSIYYYLFFAANIPFAFQNGIMILVHYWSIGVEEQFYIFFPWLVKYFKNHILKTFCILTLLLFIFKIIFWIMLGSDSIVYRFLFITRIHCMLLGGIGAYLYINKIWKFEVFLSGTSIQIISWLIYIAMSVSLIKIPTVIAHEIIALVSLSLIIGQISKSKLINLENRYFDFLGKISYSVYVIHPIVIFILSKLYKELTISVAYKYAIVYCSVIGFTVFWAWLSFSFLESPFLKLKNRYSVVKSSNSIHAKL